MFATMASAQTAMPQSAIPATGINSRVGVAAGVKGSVQLARDGGVGQVVSSGAEIYLGDKISTDAKSGLQILLLDQTTFTIGANSAIVVDQFVYDPATDAGKVSVRVMEGTFRFITGKIAHKNPQNMQVDLPNGTIGVRGTMVMGKVDGTKSLAILTGPGDKNNTGSRHGAIIVGGKGGDNSKSVRIAKTGFGTEIDGTGAPKMPFLVPQNILTDMTSQLSPPKDDAKSGEEKKDSLNSRQPGAGGSATERAGQGRIDSGKTLSNFGNLPPLDKLISPGIAQQFCKSVDVCREFLDRNATRIRDLALIPTTIAYFNSSNFPLLDGGNVQRGTFNSRIRVDASNRTAGGADSKIWGTANNSFYGTTPNIEFLLGTAVNFSSNPDDPARIAFTNMPETACPAACKANINFDLKNVNGVPAGAAHVHVVLTDSGIGTGHAATTLTGDATAPRQP